MKNFAANYCHNFELTICKKEFFPDPSRHQGVSSRYEGQKDLTITLALLSCTYFFSTRLQ